MMSAEKQLFKFGQSNREWSLDEIEDMYKCNLFNSESIILISDGPEKIFTPFKLENLIRLYGAKFPFRREPIRMNNKRIEKDFSSSDESSDGSPVIERSVRRKSVVLNEANNEYFEYERKETGESSSAAPDSAETEGTSEPKVVFRSLHYIDVPLFNSKYEKEDEILSSREIEKELDELRKIAPIPWNFSNNSLFRELNKTDDQMVLCRFCSYIPYTAKCLFEHMFSPAHRKKLVEERIGRSSFDYWRQRFEAVPKREEAQVLKGAKKQAKVFQRVPLLDNDLKPDSTEQLGDASHLPKLIKLVEQVDKRKINDEKSFFYLFIQEIGWPSCCPLCSSCSFVGKDPYNIISHIVSSSHIAALKQNGFWLKDYSFWCQNLHQLKKDEEKVEVVKETEKKTEVQKVSKPKIQKTKNSSSHQFSKVPLLTQTFPKTDNEMKKSRRVSSLQRLDVLLRSVDKNKLNSMNSSCSKVLNTIVFTKESCDFGCKPLRSTDPYSLISHCLTSPHRDKLAKFGFPVVEFEFWSNMLGQYRKAELTAEEIANDGETDSVTDSIRSSISTSVQDWKFNSPRVPLLDLNSDDVYSENDRKSLLAELSIMWKKVDAKHFKLTGEKILDYNRESTCYACKLRENCFSDAISLATHVFSPSHTKHALIRGFSQNDYFVWKNCLTRALNGDLPKQTTVKQEKKQCDIVVNIPAFPPPTNVVGIPIIQKEKTVDKPQTSNVLTNLRPNSPRIPLLDAPLGLLNGLPQDEIEKEYAKLVEKMNQVTDKLANKVYPPTKHKVVVCSVCTNKSKPYLFGTVALARRHVTSAIHKEQVNFEITRSDFEFWNDLFDKCIEQKNKDSKEKSVEQEKLNSPHIPLLDESATGGKSLSKDEVEKEFAKLLAKSKQLSDKLLRKLYPHQKGVVFQCKFCKRSDVPITFETLPSVAQHVLSNAHRQQINCELSQSDFDYWHDFYDLEKHGDKLEQNDVKKILQDELKKKAKEEEKKNREEPNTPSQPNYPRIPLLDLPLATSEEKSVKLDPDFEYKYDMLRSNWRFTPTEVTKKMLKNRKVYCNICFQCDGLMVEMCSLFDIGNHVFDEEHKKRLNQRATAESFKYWDDIFKRIGIMRSKEKGHRNAIHIPLLDGPMTDLDLVEADEIDKIWDELDHNRMKLRKKLNLNLNFGFNSKVRCFVCENGYSITSPSLLVHHVLTFVHKENMKKVGVSERDVGFWRELLDKPDRNETKREFFALGLMYSNAEYPMISTLKKQVLSEEKVAEKFKELRNKVKNVPIPNFNGRFKNLPSQHDRKNCTWCGTALHAPFHFLEHVASIKHEKNVLKYCKATDKDFEEWFDRIKIIDEMLLNEKLKSERRQQLEEQLRKKTESSKPSTSSLPEEKKKELLTPTSPTPTQTFTKPAPVFKIPSNNEPTVDPVKKPDNRPLFRKFPERYAPGEDNYTQPVPVCRLPLFVERRGYGRGVIGPSVEEIEFIEQNVPFFPADSGLEFGCAICNVNLQNHDFREFVRHVFSVTHLKKLTDFGVKLFAEDFSYWFDFYKRKLGSRTIKPVSNIWAISRFDVTKPLTGPMFTPGFLDPHGPKATLSNSHLQLVTRLDCIKFDASSNVYKNRNASGCQFCNRWLFTPSDVAKHCVSHEHFLNFQKRGAQISRLELMYWVDEMKKYQLPEEKTCVIM